MPEGPEIKLAADNIARAIVNKQCTKILFAFTELRGFEKELQGRMIRSVETRGKAMLTFFDNDMVIYSHNQLYGKWLVCKGGAIPDSKRQVRLAIYTHDCVAVLFSASDIQVLNKEALPQHPFLKKLGPDVLSQTPSEATLVARLRSKAFDKKQLAGVLLDQSFVAGLGNYLRAEILFHARLHPSMRPCDCSSIQLKSLAKHILKITLRAYTNKGVINSASLIKKLKAQGKTQKEAHRFAVYGRESQSCYTCGTKIGRMNSGGRHIFFCPGCQTAAAH